MARQVSDWLGSSGVSPEDLFHLLGKLSHENQSVSNGTSLRVRLASSAPNTLDWLRIGPRSNILTQYITIGTMTSTSCQVETSHSTITIERLERRHGAGPDQGTSTMPQPTVRPSTWGLLDQVLPASARVALWGPPGTGKTYAAITNRAPNTGFYSLIMTEDSPVAELRGHYIQRADGSFHWHHGPAIRAWLEGARLVINEINRASPEVQSFLYALLDDPQSAHLTIPTGETLTPHPSFSCVATMNADPEDLPEALADRFPICIEVAEIHPAALRALPEDLRDIAAQLALHTDPARRIGLRTWMEYARLRTSINPQLAAWACFNDRAEELLDSINIASVASLLPDDQRGAWAGLSNPQTNEFVGGPGTGLANTPSASRLAQNMYLSAEQRKEALRRYEEWSRVMSNGGQLSGPEGA
jgi:hypothetical protein